MHILCFLALQRGMFSSDAWQSMIKVAGAATALVGVSAQVLLAGGTMEQARAAATQKASDRWKSAAMLARRAMHLPQLAAELCVRGKGHVPCPASVYLASGDIAVQAVTLNPKPRS